MDLMEVAKIKDKEDLSQDSKDNLNHLMVAIEIKANHIKETMEIVEEKAISTIEVVKTVAIKEDSKEVKMVLKESLMEMAKIVLEEKSINLTINKSPIKQKSKENHNSMTID